MESFGEYLKSLREEKGKTLEQIAESTKIAVANLESLERDRYDLLPPRVFVKGFIRSYVNELGLNPEEAIRRFEEFIKIGELPDYSPEEQHPVFHQKPPTESFASNRVFTIILTAAGAISLVILLITGVSRLFLDQDVEGKRDESAAPVVQSVGPRSTTTEKAVFPEPTRTQTGKRQLEIKALASTWIRIEPDSGPAEELMMAPGDVQVFTAKQSFYLQTGNAGGIRLRFDGKELPPLGKPNQTLSLTLP
jgi:cytoskeletal protein RodZ